MAISAAERELVNAINYYKDRRLVDGDPDQAAQPGLRFRPGRHRPRRARAGKRSSTSNGPIRGWPGRWATSRTIAPNSAYRPKIFSREPAPSSAWPSSTMDPSRARPSSPPPSAPGSPGTPGATIIMTSCAGIFAGWPRESPSPEPRRSSTRFALTPRRFSTPPTPVTPASVGLARTRVSSTKRRDRGSSSAPC